MSNYSYSTFPYAGLMFDGFLTEDGQTWVTLASVANGLELNRQMPRNWVRRRKLQPQQVLKVQVGKFRKAAEAYPVAIIGEFVEALSKKGNAKAQALLTASFVADLDRTVKETNGLQVTADQHEANRERIRVDLLKTHMAAYTPIVEVTSCINWRQQSEELTDEENHIADDLAYIKTKQVLLQQRPQNAERYQQSIDKAILRLESRGVPVRDIIPV